MGYWSEHPMGGDAPLDVKSELDSFLFPEKDRVKMDETEYKTRLIANLNEIIGLDYIRGEHPTDEMKEKSRSVLRNFMSNEEQLERTLRGMFRNDCSFVLPFTLIEHEIGVKDKALSDKVKSMIGDGGAYERGYDVPKNTDENYPDKENNWNDLESPFDFAVKLYDLWDGMMEGSVTFDVLENDEGLFSVLAKHQGPGMVNKK
jgi:hypothetical protein